MLGSTGSIGTQALDIVQRNRDRFEVVGLGAGRNTALLAAQAVALRAPVIAASVDDPAELEDAVAQAVRATDAPAYRPEILTGPDAATALAERPCDVVLNGITGAVGLAPTLAALRTGRTLALANKESLIIGGPLVKALAAPGQLVPVDSEHSALAQCLRGGRAGEVRRLVVTASGGPFRGMPREALHDVTPAQALAHPTWDMGKVVTTNSATLVNKGLEVIEAHLLFDIPFDRITVVVHPQSIVHSMVEFVDGSTLAQASPPDMRLPIALGMAWPDRVPGAAPACDWSRAATWEFFALDDDAFPAVRLAREVGAAGGVLPAVYNAANEVCVEAFHDGAIRFTAIVDTVEQVVRDATSGGHGIPDRPGMPATHGIPGTNDAPGQLTYTSVIAADDWARRRAADLLGLAVVRPDAGSEEPT